jgi:hypothetical protein
MILESRKAPMQLLTVIGAAVGAALIYLARGVPCLLRRPAVPFATPLLRALEFGDFGRSRLSLPGAE